MRRSAPGSPLVALALLLVFGCGASAADAPRDAVVDLAPPPPAASEPPPVAASSAPAASGSAVPAASAATASPAAATDPALPDEIAYVFSTLEDLAPDERASFDAGVDAFRRKDFAAAEKAFTAAWEPRNDARLQLLIAQMQMLQGKRKQACDNFAEGWNRGASLFWTRFRRVDLPTEKCPRLSDATYNRP